MVDISDLLGFIAASPSPHHVVETAVGRLDRAGFSEVHDGDAWAGGGRRYRRAGGSLVAWDDTHVDLTSGFRIVGAHTDSPNLRLKPRPDRVRHGFRQAGVEVYGGVLLNSWLDRDLGLSGRCFVNREEGVEEHLVLIDRPVARLPQLAIHLDREVNQGLRLDPQAHLWPVLGLGSAPAVEELIAEAIDVRPDEIRSWELMFHDLTPPALLGADGSLIAAPRIDNQLSCWAGLEALLTGTASESHPTTIPLLCLFDHEEVGSASTTGAAGPILETVLERSVLARGGDREDLLRARSRSFCLSADGAHATHPNFPERSDPEHEIRIDGGPVVKINGNQRYATDAAGTAHVIELCHALGLPHQQFVTRNDMPCGSTIGPITATRLGIPTVDVGVAQLSMHSARELCGSEDPVRFVDLLRAVLHGS